VTSETLLLNAYSVAASKHALQMRKGIPEPYINHCVRVALAATGLQLPHEAVAASLLHDVVEDTPTTLVELYEMGFPARTVELVDGLTKRYGDQADAETKARLKPEYYARILQDKDLIVLKLLDRIDNLRDMRKLLRITDDRKLVKWAGAYLRKTQVEFPPLLEVLPKAAAPWVATPVATWFYTEAGHLTAELQTALPPPVVS